MLRICSSGWRAAEARLRVHRLALLPRPTSLISVLRLGLVPGLAMNLVQRHYGRIVQLGGACDCVRALEIPVRELEIRGVRFVRIGEVSEIGEAHTRALLPGVRGRLLDLHLPDMRSNRQLAGLRTARNLLVEH